MQNYYKKNYQAQLVLFKLHTYAIH